jgi:hypothetical protein
MVSDSVNGPTGIATISAVCAALSVPCTCTWPATGTTTKSPEPSSIDPCTPPTPVPGREGSLGPSTGRIGPLPRTTIGGADATPAEPEGSMGVPELLCPTIGTDETGGTETGAKIGATSLGLDEPGGTDTGARIGAASGLLAWVGADEPVGDCRRFETVEVAPVCGIGKAGTIGAAIIADEDRGATKARTSKAWRAAPRESKTRSSRSSTIRHGNRATSDRARLAEPSARIPQRRRPPQFITTCGLRFLDPVTSRHGCLFTASIRRAFSADNIP